MPAERSPNEFARRARFFVKDKRNELPKNLGMLLLAIYLILIGIIGLFSVAIPPSLWECWHLPPEF